MSKKLDENNRRAPRVNPGKSGIRTGNPQLEPGSGEGGRANRPKRRPVKAKEGERRGS